MLTRTLAAVVLAVLFTSQGFAVGVTEVPVTPRKPVIDGKITDDEKKGASVTSMTLISGFALPKHATDVYMLVGDDGLYVAYDCKDPDTSGIIVNVKKENGAVMSDDSVELVIAPAKEATRSNYFHFALNAGNFGYSSSMADDQAVADWKHGTSRTASGWQAEILIPLASIGASSDLTHWRGNMARNRPARGSDPEEQSAWVGGMSTHNYRRFGFLRLIQAPYPEIANLTGPTARGTTTMTATTATTGTTAPR